MLDEPRRLSDEIDSPAIRRLLQAAKHDGAPAPSGTKQRVQAAVLAQLWTQAEMNRSGVRFIDNGISKQNGPSPAGSRVSIVPVRPRPSWMNHVFPMMAIATFCAFVLYLVGSALVGPLRSARMDAAVSISTDNEPRSNLAPPHAASPGVSSAENRDAAPRDKLHRDGVADAVTGAGACPSPTPPAATSANAANSASVPTPRRAATHDKRRRGCVGFGADEPCEKPE